MHKKTDKFGSLPARYCLQEPYTRHIILKAVIEEVEDLPVVTLAAALDAREEAVEPCDTLGEHRPTIRDDLTRALHLLALIALVLVVVVVVLLASGGRSSLILSEKVRLGAEGKVTSQSESGSSCALRR